MTNATIIQTIYTIETINDEVARTIPCSVINHIIDAALQAAEIVGLACVLEGVDDTDTTPVLDTTDADDSWNN